MSARPGPLHPANTTVDSSTPFPQRAEHVRQVARDVASADVEAIRVRGQAELNALRQRHALELMAAEGESKARAPSWLVPCVLVVLAGLGGGAVMLLDRTQLSQDPEWSFSPPELDVDVAIAFSDAHAEREVAAQSSGKRIVGVRKKASRADCDPNSFDPIDSCL